MIMETTLNIPSSSMIPHLPRYHHHLHFRGGYGFRLNPKFNPVSCCSISSSSTSFNGANSRAADRQRQLNTLESLFCYDKAIPEQIIEKPVGLSVAEKEIGDQPRCTDCQAKGAVLCATCGGSGLYVDSIMESQGIIVKVRCLCCGGVGNNMCSACGGRGHL